MKFLKGGTLLKASSLTVCNWGEGGGGEGGDFQQLLVYSLKCRVRELRLFTVVSVQAKSIKKSIQ